MKNKNKLITKKTLYYAIAAITAGQFANMASASSDIESKANKILKYQCGTCHESTSGNQLNRISDGRRTPEGWDMTIGRMVAAHGLKISQKDRRTLVKYLADTQGMAPEETADWRYILERDYSVIEEHENQLVGETCARCHSYARVALQARTAEDWKKLASFHVGQFPTVEISAGGRDRDWFDLASKEVPSVLSNLKPLNSKDWNSWKDMAKSDFSGEWRVVGHEPGRGDFEGVLSVKKTNKDNYKNTLTLNFANGQSETIEGNAIVYTGYEWRASFTKADKTIHQVLASNRDGNKMTGRYYQDDVFTMGGNMTAYKIDKHSGNQVLSTYPTSLKKGETTTLTLNGINLDGKVTADSGIEIVDIVERSKNQITLRVKGNANEKNAAIYVGDKANSAQLYVYNKIDYIDIAPEHPLAKVGGNGGKIPKQPIQFEALAYSSGADNKQGTADDVMLGYVPAQWSVHNGNENAVTMRDTEYAGDLLENGLFIPGAAGPNKERKYKTNNVGELIVRAEVNDGATTHKAERDFVVSVQRWNNPPIF